MQQVSKEVFQEMIEKGILKTNTRDCNFTVTCRNKSKGKRKKHYVSTPDYSKYLRLINKNKKYYPKGSC